MPRRFSVPLFWLAASLTAGLALALLPAGTWSTAIAVVYPLAATGVVAFGARRHHGAERPAWVAIAAGLVLLGTGHALGALTSDAAIHTPGLLLVLPSNALTIAGSLSLLVGMARPFRAHDHDRGDILDGLVLASAMASVVWTVVIDPFVGGSARDPLLVALAVAHPIVDLVLLGLLVGAVRRGVDAAGIFGIGIACLLVGDLAVVWPVVGGRDLPALSSLGWLTGFALLGAGALWPSRARLPRAGGRAHVLTTTRLMLLAGAALVPLAMAVVQEMRHDEPRPMVVGLASSAMFLVVVARLALLVRRQRDLLDERHQLEATLQRQASEDPLTGLPNRRGFTEGLHAALARDAAGVAVLILDLDDFKIVNDSLGHPAGDHVLRMVGRRLRRAIRAQDTVARIGGDEFAVTMTGSDAPGRAITVADRILASLAEPVAIGGRQLSVTMSVGIARSDGHDATAESLLRDADSALYHAKRQGGKRWEVYGADLHAADMRDHAIVDEIGRADGEREFELAFQPIISLVSGRVEAMEALVRWRHPDLGLLLPGEFLHAAEQSGHMLSIGRWILDEACRVAAGWRFAGIHDVGINVNLSPVQLVSDDILEDVRAALRASGLPAEQLTLEILESSFDHTVGVISRLAALRELGVRLSIDDFGTAFASLSSVAEATVTELKVDRSLVAGRSDPRMLAAVIRLGQTLGLRVVAEGVETKREWERVRDLGYDAAQGYYASRPVSAAEVTPLLLSWTGRSTPAARRLVTPAPAPTAA